MKRKSALGGKMAKAKKAKRSRIKPAHTVISAKGTEKVEPTKPEPKVFKSAFKISAEMDPVLGWTSTWVAADADKHMGEQVEKAFAKQFITVTEQVSSEERMEALEKFWVELNPKVREEAMVFLYKWMKVPAMARAATAYTTIRHAAGSRGNLSEETEKQYLTRRGLVRRVRVNANLADLNAAIEGLFVTLCRAADDEVEAAEK